MQDSSWPTIISIICTAVVGIAPYLHSSLEKKRSEKEFHYKRKFDILERFSRDIDAFAGSGVDTHLNDTINLMYLYCKKSCHPLLDQIVESLNSGNRSAALRLSRELISSIDIRKGGPFLTLK